MTKNWTKIQQKYKGLWVALADDEETVLGAGKTVHEAKDEAVKKGNRDPILTRMPESAASYVGGF